MGRWWGGDEWEDGGVVMSGKMVGVVMIKQLPAFPSVL